MNTGEIVDLLGQTTMFAGMRPAELEKLAGFANERSFKKGSLIFYQGDPGDAFYVVASGSVKVFLASKQAEEMVLVTLRPPDVLGEVAVLDGGPRSASAEALEPTMLLAFARSMVLQLMSEEPAIAEGLLQSVGNVVRRLTRQTADFVFLDLEGRVAKALVDFADQRGETIDDVIVLDLGITQTDLANMVGGSRQSVNQILHGLEDRGYLEVEHGRSIRIKDIDGLRRRAGL